MLCPEALRGDAIGLDKYKLGEPLGRGYKSSVYAAKHIRTGTQVALKQYVKDRLDPPEARQVRPEGPTRFFLRMRSSPRARSPIFRHSCHLLHFFSKNNNQNVSSRLNARSRCTQASLIATSSLCTPHSRSVPLYLLHTFRTSLPSLSLYKCSFLHDCDPCNPAQQDEEAIYLVLEHCSQGDLYSLKSRWGGRLDERSAVSLVIHPMLSVLSFLHGEGIVHRDIKASPTSLALLRERAALRNSAT